jgi:hypothetical protein
MAKSTRLKRFRPAQKPNWDGVRFERSSVGCDDSVYEHNGYHYCTWGELQIARLLTAMGIAFTSNVRFAIQNDGTFKKVNGFVPDFVFNGDTYVWTEDNGTEIEIHGIECKATNKKPDKARLLYEQRGIHILVLADAEIEFYSRQGRLPLRLLKRFNK